MHNKFDSQELSPVLDSAFPLLYCGLFERNHTNNEHTYTYKGRNAVSSPSHPTFCIGNVASVCHA